jgi:glycosyltransferase involved in cell wall biosynthesis
VAQRARELRSVLIVSYEYPPLGGGGGVMIATLAEELAKQIQITVLTSGRTGLAETEKRDGLEIVRVPVWMRHADATASLLSMLSFFPLSLRRGAALMRSRRFDLIHSSFAVPSGPSGLRLARQAGIPHVLSVHGGDLYDPSKLLSPHRTPALRQTVRWVIQGSDCVVGTSSDVIDRVRRIYVDREVERVPLAFRPLECIPGGRARLGLRESDRVLVTVGRLVPRKGLDQLLRVVAKLADPALRLVVVGEGPAQPALLRSCAELGIADRVRFTGFVSEEEKCQVLSAADLYVSTTLHEGFGIVFLEALSRGLPVICYDEGGQVDFIDDAVGALVPVNDEAAFGEAVRRHLSAPDLLRSKSAAARQRVADFSIERFAQRYREIYRRCLAEGLR